MQRRIAGRDNPPPAGRRAAVPARDPTAGPFDDRDQRDDVVGLEAGLDDDGFARLWSPIGLDLGGRTPEETAVSICAEIIASRTGRELPSLRETEGPIHKR